MPHNCRHPSNPLLLKNWTSLVNDPLFSIFISIFSNAAIFQVDNNVKIVHINIRAHKKIDKKGRKKGQEKAFIFYQI